MFRAKKTETLGNAIVSLTGSKIAVMGISMIINMFLARFRTLEEFGTYSQVTLAINLATTMFMLGLPNSLNYFLAKADTAQERSHFLSVYYSLNTLLSILVGVILIAAIPLLEKYFHNPLIRSFAFYLALFPWTRIIHSSIENILIVYERSDAIVWFRIVNSIGNLCCLFVVQWNHWSFMTYMALQLLLEIGFSLVTYGTAAKLAQHLYFSLDSHLISQIFSFSIPIGLASVVGTLSVELDKLMVGFLMDTEQLAIYTNAAKEMPVTVLASSVTAVIMPNMVRLLKDGRGKQAIQLWKNATEFSFSVICFCTVVLFAFAPEVITVLYSEKYLPGVSVFRVYSLALLFRCTYFGMVLNAINHTKCILYSSIASLVLNVVLNYVFFRVFGITGPALATFVSLIPAMMVQLYYTAKLTRLSIYDVFPWKNCFYKLLKQATLAVVMYTFKELSPLDQIIARLLSMKAVDSRAVEAIILGVLWIGMWLLLEVNPLKRLWLELNHPQDKI